MEVHWTVAEARKKYFHIHSLEKGIRVLELLADKQELTVTNVAKALGINRASSHRFLATLRELGYVRKNEDSRYQLTFKILELGMKFANRFEVRRVARPFMQDLSEKFNETVNLGFWDGEIVVHLDRVESREILRMELGLGSRAPAYCTGLGKAVLAHLPRDERESFLERIKPVRYTPNTITERKKLLQELNAVREKGYAIDNEELAVGLRCVAAPVFDYTGLPRYAISIAGPESRMTDRIMRKMEKEVRRVCSSLSKALGAPSEQAETG
jgi:DNA-binding IclR family transcriptional regulator